MVVLMDDLESRVLNILLMSSGYVSGVGIANALGISRATVNRVVRRLVSRGFAIEVHPRLGYRLMNIDDISIASRYVSIIDTHIKFSIYYLETCSSTQDVADSLAREGVSEGTVVISEKLTRGRGRMGRHWIADKGGLWLSIVFRPKEMRYIHLMSIAVGVAVANTIKQLLNIDAKVKWPNDILVNDKKVAGILVEGKVEADRVHYLVVGIGINVNNDLPEELKENATTLKEIIGRQIPRVPILITLLKNIDEIYRELSRDAKERVLDLWRSLSATIGRMVKVITHGEEIIGIAEDIDRDGSLIIRKPDGSKTKIYAGDVIHLRYG